MGTSKRIPLFELFGEDGGGGDAEFIHLEDIQSRSSLYNWEISPHAHGHLFQSVIIQSGDAVVRIDGVRQHVAGPAAILLPPGVVHDFQFRPGTHGHVLTIAESVLVGAAPPQARSFAQALCAEARIIPLGGQPGDTARIAILIGQLEAEFHSAHPGRNLMFDWLVRAILMQVVRQSPRAGEEPGLDRNRVRLFNRFRRLVEEHYLEHWPVSRYAGDLGTTEGQLNRLCRRYGGRSTHEIIRDRLMLEARRRLIYIAAPVTRLAYELGFEDPSYFCRFFKKYAGLSPAEFRSREHRPEGSNG